MLNHSVRRKKFMEERRRPASETRTFHEPEEPVVNANMPWHEHSSVILALCHRTLCLADGAILAKQVADRSPRSGSPCKVGTSFHMQKMPFPSRGEQPHSVFVFVASGFDIGLPLSRNPCFRLAGGQQLRCFCFYLGPAFNDVALLAKCRIDGRYLVQQGQVLLHRQRNALGQNQIMKTSATYAWKYAPFCQACSCHLSRSIPLY